MTLAPATEADWRAAAERVLKGRTLEEFVTLTLDGIRIEPLYAPHIGGPVADVPHRPMRLFQRVDHPEPGPALALARTDLAGGATGLVLVARGARSARGFGLAADDLARLLDAPELRGADIRINGDLGAAEPLLDRLVQGRETGGRLHLGLDPLHAPSPDWLRRADGDVFGEGLFLADGRPFHEAGASEAQELGAVLAGGVAALRRLEAAGWALERAAGAVSFLLVTDADLLLSVAKLRAFRALWAGVLEASGLPPGQATVHTETAWRMMTRRDPATNMLRNALATLAAALGGADTLTVLPHSVAAGLPDAFARRVARNTQLVATEEAGLRRTADPLAGSGAVESLTAALVERGWAAFRQIEGEGGLAASLEIGALPGRIAEVRERRLADLREGRATIVGTTAFVASEAEGEPVILLPEPRHLQQGVMPSLRLAEAFEVA